MSERREILKEIDKRGASRAKIGGFDIEGVLRGKYVSVDKLKSALKKGFGFCDVIFGWDVADVLYDNSEVTGFHTGYPDAHAVLDPRTFRWLPWEDSTPCLLADFRNADGGPHPACPRSLLRRVIERAEGRGFSPKFAAEFEFFFFRETPQSLHAKGFAGLTPLSPGMFGYSWVREGQHKDLMRAIWDQMAAFDIPLEGLHTETGPGVYEVAITVSDILSAADRAALFKTALKQIAHDHGLSVTFMAKWNADLPGSGGHIHQSLWKGDDNVFAGSGAEPNDLLRHYVAGQIALLPEITPLFAPNINSYKRYVPGIWAPVTATWGVENRTAGLRIIGLGTSAARVESRMTGADLNPYLGMAACLAAGLHGIEQKLEPPAPVRGDAASKEVAAEAALLPRSLGEATERLAKSEVARELFGDAFVDHYVRTRLWEVRQFDLAVTDWELKRYFEAI